MNSALRKFSLVAIVALLAGIVPMAHGAGAATAAEDEQFAPHITGDRGEMVFQLLDGSDLHDNVSVLTGHSDSTGDKICSATTDAACASGYQFRAVLSPCESATAVDCIESFSGTTSDGTAVAGVFKQHFPLRGLTDYTGSVADSVPSGGTPGLWTLAGLPHGFGNDYELTVQVSGSKVNGDALTPARAFNATITPVSVFRTGCSLTTSTLAGTCRATYLEQTLGNGKTGVSFASPAFDQDNGYHCRSWGEDQNCTLQHAFPAGAKFAVKVRLSTSPSGWLHGRMQDPVASIDRANNVTTVNISAAPTKVPLVVGEGQWATLPTTIQDSYTKACLNVRCGTKRGLDDPTKTTFTMDQRQIIMSPNAFSTDAFDGIKLWSGYMKDTASAMPSAWSVHTLSDSEMKNAPDCIKNGVGVTGIVATNASAYAEGPPSFDKATSTLNYKVAAMHFDKDGVTPFAGQYTLILRADIADCLYGVKDSEAESTISVTGEDGAVKTATTAFKLANGWFTFSASGFGHSAPTIQVKLTSPTKVNAVKKGTLTSRSQLIKMGKLKYTSTAKWLVRVSTPTVCKVSGTGIKNLAKGTCKVTVSVTPAATKKAPKPKTTSAKISLVVS